MGLFGKGRKSEMIDFTKIQNKRDSPRTETERNDVELKNNLQSGVGQFGFLNSLANVGTETGSITDSLRTARQRGQLNSEISEIKIRIDDTNYKISSLSDKIRQIEEKLKAFEKIR